MIIRKLSNTYLDPKHKLIDTYFFWIILNLFKVLNYKLFM